MKRQTMTGKSYKEKQQHRLQKDTSQTPVYEYLLPPKRTKSPYEAKLMQILLEPTNFKKKFTDLKLDEQLAMNQLLAEISEHGKSENLKGFARDFAEGAEYLLDNIHQIAGTEYDKGIFTKIHRDEKRLIRMECHGTINLRTPHQLSIFYKFFSKPENKGKWGLRAYDMKKSPMWRVFMQFESFRKITQDIRKYMQKNGINPDALKVMTVSDFCDVIFQAYQKSSKDTKVSFLPEGESIKAKYVKEFMQRCGDKYKKLKLEEASSRGVRPEAVESLCNAMRLWGVTEPSRITVTSFEYTPQIIKDLTKAGYDVKGIEVGSPIPQEFTDYLIMHRQEKLIQARDENGKLITTEGLEGEELHHIGAVLIAANNGYLARTDYPNMLVLLNPRFHGNYVHYFDRILKQNDEEEFYQRLTIKDKKTRLMLGFGKNKCILADFENGAEFKKRETEDMLYVVNYNKMTAVRLKNEVEIAQKYKINYTKVAITQKLEEIKNIKGTSKSDIQEFEGEYIKWLKEQKKNRRQKKETAHEAETKKVSKEKTSARKKIKSAENKVKPAQKEENVKPQKPQKTLRQRKNLDKEAEFDRQVWNFIYERTGRGHKIK